MCTWICAKTLSHCYSILLLLLLFILYFLIINYIENNGDTMKTVRMWKSMSRWRICQPTWILMPRRKKRNATNSTNSKQKKSAKRCTVRVMKSRVVATTLSSADGTTLVGCSSGKPMPWQFWANTEGTRAPTNTTVNKCAKVTKI